MDDINAFVQEREMIEEQTRIDRTENMFGEFFFHPFDFDKDSHLHPKT